MVLKLLYTLLFVILFVGCDYVQITSEKLRSKIEKRIDALDSLSPANRDSLTVLKKSIVALLRENELEFVVYADTFLTLDKSYATSRADFEKVVVDYTTLYYQNILAMAKVRMEMRNYLTEEQWQDFTLIRLKKKED